MPGERPVGDDVHKVGGVRSVLNALHVLQEFRGREPLGVSDLSRRVGLPKTNIQRVLATLHADGWIMPTDTAPTRWLPSEKLLIFASGVYRSDSLRLAAAPILKELRDATMESVTLSVRNGASMVLVDRADSTRRLRVHSEVGTIIPIYIASSGRAVLAKMDRKAVRELIGEFFPRQLGDRYVTLREFEKELDEAAERGYAVNLNLWSDEVVGIGASVPAGSRYSEVGIALAIPTSRADKDRIESLGQMIVDASTRIRERLVSDPL